MIDLHLADKTQGFVKTNNLNIGERINVVVREIPEKSTIVKCDLKGKPIDYSRTVIFEKIKPGLHVYCKVEKVVDNGVHVSFCNGVEGTIFIDHLNRSIHKYKRKDKIEARVVYVDVQKKRISLSQKDHILQLSRYSPGNLIGQFIEKPRVVEVLYGSVILEGKVKETGKTVKAFLHHTHVDSDLVTKTKKRESKAAKKDTDSKPDAL